MELGDVQRRFSEGFDSFLREERELFTLSVGERTLAAALRGHLDRRFEDLSVDAEYNRHRNEPKYLSRYRALLEEHGLSVPDRDQPRSIDLVVHRRGDDSRNLLAIEIKRSENAEDRRYDRLKLQALRVQLRYSFTLFLEIGPNGDRVEEEWTCR